eukprot:g12382.t1
MQGGGFIFISSLGRKGKTESRRWISSVAPQFGSFSNVVPAQEGMWAFWKYATCRSAPPTMSVGWSWHEGLRGAEVGEGQLLL